MRMKNYTVCLAALGGAAVAFWQLLSSGGPLIPSVGVSIGVGLVMALLASVLFPLARRVFGNHAPAAAPEEVGWGVISGNARRKTRCSRRSGARGVPLGHQP